ncbi:MAG: hypothetical protein WCK59_00675 [Candidatus Falkowbacteria bacterium]
MRLVWRIIYNLILVLVFVILSIFSLVEYRSADLNLNTTSDKFTLTKNTLTSFSYLIAYLEKMPTIRLLPVVTKELVYQKQMLDDLALESNKSPIIKENTPIINDNLTTEITWSEIISRLKNRLSKDWFRP